MIETTLIILALAIAYGVWLNIEPRADREKLRRQYEAARRDHKARREIHKLFVRATTEQIKRECV